LTVYPPTELVAVLGVPSPSRAFESESQIAHSEARRTSETTAVVCDGEVVG